MKKKYTILANLNSFEFPLSEAMRKQIWWMATEKNKMGFNVEIILLSNHSSEEEKDNIKIKFVNKFKYLPCIKSDYIHFINPVVSHWLIVLFCSRGYKILTLTDGMIWANSKYLIRKAISKIIPLIYNEINVYSQFQKSMLGLKRTKIIQPILPVINKSKLYSKTKNPTLLYMGHLSSFKGVDMILKSFDRLIFKYPNLRLIIANNMLYGEAKITKEVDRYKKLFPENIIIKGIVDPIEELSKSWVYLYPFTIPYGTMAYPLSLYESQQCDTPFIACNIGAVPEYFDSKYIIAPFDIISMVKKIEGFIIARKAEINL